MKRIAFLTMDSLEGFFAYDRLAFEPLAQRGYEVDEVPWRKNNVIWQDYAMVVIRSPWDYQQHPTEFLQRLAVIEASGTRLENEMALVRWNIHKSYLRDLQQKGIPIVPTEWMTGLSEQALSTLLNKYAPGEVVIKPVVGANADDTFRLSRSTAPSLKASLLQTFSGRELMIQPFLQSIVSEGEYSLFYFDGQYSHCILKKPAPGDFRVQEEHGGTIHTVDAPASLTAAAARVLSVLHGQPLYARVDLVHVADQGPSLIELELIEPSLYLASDPLAPERFAQAIVRRDNAPRAQGALRTDRSAK